MNVIDIVTQARDILFAEGRYLTPPDKPYTCELCGEICGEEYVEDDYTICEHCRDATVDVLEEFVRLAAINHCQSNYLHDYVKDEGFPFSRGFKEVV